MTQQDVIDLIEVIRTETVEDANSAQRVGYALAQILDFFLEKLSDTTTEFQTQLNQESGNRGTADGQLQANINNEAMIRANRDNSLQQNIDSETTARLLLASTLNAELDGEMNNRISADNLLLPKANGYFKGIRTLSSWDSVSNIISILGPGSYGVHLNSAFGGYSDFTVEISYSSYSNTGKNSKQDYIIRFVMPDGKIYTGKAYYDENNDLVLEQPTFRDSGGGIIEETDPIYMEDKEDIYNKIESLNAGKLSVVDSIILDIDKVAPLSGNYETLYGILTGGIIPASYYKKGLIITFATSATTREIWQFQNDVIEPYTIEVASNWKRILDVDLKNQDIAILTYDELVDKINNSKLNSASKYLISDFKTTHYMLDGSARIASSINVGNLEPLIVTATSNSSISNIVESLIHPKDLIYYDWNPQNWLTDKCLIDSNGNIISGFKGFIYRRVDNVYSLDVPYDFRNVKFRLWGTSAVVDGLPNKYSSFSTTGTTGQTVPDANDFRDLYLFSDITTMGYYSGDLLFNIKIEFTSDTQNENIQIGTRLLPNLFWGRNYGVVLKSYAMFNILGENCKDTTIGRYSEQNIIGTLCHTNTIKDNCVSNIISYGQANVLDSFCSHNIFYKDGNANNNNILFYSASYNNFHNGSSSNRLGVSSSNNTFAGYNNFNVVGDASNYNSFDFDSDNNIIGNYSSNNTFGQQCKQNRSGNYCLYNTFNNYCGNNSLSDNCSSNVFPANFDCNNLESISGIDFSIAKYSKILNKTFYSNVRKATDNSIIILSANPIKTVTLNVANWSSAVNANGFYYYTVTDNYLMSNNFIDAVFANADIEAVLTAGIKPSVTVADGSFIIEAESIPTSNLTLTYKIL